MALDNKTTTLLVRAQAVSTVTIAVILVAASLQYLKSIAIPFVLALFISFIAAPLIEWLKERWRLPRALSFVIIFGLFCVVALGFTSMFLVSMKTFAANFQEYLKQMPQLAEQLAEKLSSIGIDLKSDDYDKMLSDFPLLNFTRTILTTFVGKASNFVGNFSLVMIFVLFLLTDRFTLPDTPVWREIDVKVRSYLVTKSIASLATGLLTGTLLWLLDVDMAWMFGLMAFLLNFIPTVGSLAAMVLPLPFALIQFGFDVRVVWVLVLPGAVQFVIGNIIEPKVMGDSLGLHPVSILMALIFWGFIWGIPGMFLAAPIAVVGQIAMSHFPPTEGIARLMAGKTQP